LRALVKQVESDWPRPRLVAALRRAKLVARGPKPAAMLRELGLSADVMVPEPNTWRELLAALDAGLPVAGRVVAVQEYGISNPELVQGLQERGASVRRVVIYRWELPEDLAPLRGAIAALQQQQADVVVFTSANQVYTLFEFAEREAPGAAARLRHGMRQMLIASIGPVCSQALREHELPPDFEPQHPKMGHLIVELGREAAARLAAKRR
jgi:uroporphyrinogen-III synthase